jgi:hypothetical protein
MSYRDYLETAGRKASKPAFGRTELPLMLNRGQVGFTDTTGFHIYCELRPTAKFESAESDAKALKYLQVIEEYVNHGVRAATPFGVVLLELQGNVLHFYKPGDAAVQPAIEAIQFVYLFTTTLYEELKPELGDEWDGFASCMMHGRSIVVRHGSFHSASAVSLGPAANEPAKQLLYGKTPAGCLDVPGVWAKELELPPAGKWVTINLRGRDRVPFLNRVENQQRRQELLSLIREYRAVANRKTIQRVSLIENRQLFDPSGFTLTSPHRVQAFCLRSDLDGFSAVLKEVFEQKNDKAVERVALGFAEILEFGDYMERSTPGSIRLPWAGDCATLLVPHSPDFSLASLPRWLEVALKWQSFADGTPEASVRNWGSIFKSVRWAIGACHGEAGMNVVAPIQAQGRSFLVGAGWPVATSLDAQNLGKGGDIVTHNIDFANLDTPTRKQFAKVENTEFWRTTNLNKEKLKKSAIEVGQPQAPVGEDYLAKYRSIQVPSPRPHYQ